MPTSPPARAVANLTHPPSARPALNARSAWLRGLASGGGITLVAWLDFVTGTEISFSVFYLAPIAWLTWQLGRRSGLTLALLAACAWYAAERLGGQHYSHVLIPVWNASVRLAFFVLAVEALHRIRETMIVAQALARTDSLTGLANARAFRESLERELARARRYQRPLAVAYLDVDNFKQVNDTLGHEEGDRVLGLVGETLLRNLREVDAAARLGGDEFAILLPETRRAGARATVEKLHQHLSGAAHDQGWPISFSVGLVSFDTPPATTDELVRRADETMYQVKRNGKNAIGERCFE